VILAVPFDAVHGLVQSVDDWNGRIIVDATNAIDFTDFSPADLDGKPCSDLVEEWATNARVVKAFGSTWAKILARDPDQGAHGRRVMFLSGNHPAANSAIATLITHMGFAPIDLGRNDQGGAWGDGSGRRQLAAPSTSGSTARRRRPSPQRHVGSGPQGCGICAVTG
jgi:8-hydroxy-5-deazaflavin:NADPH oxidoreductase